MSLCNICPRPGRCCTGFMLNGGEAVRHGTELEAIAKMASIFGTAPDTGKVEYGLPFRPLFRDQDGRWRWWCPNLTRDGRCGDYENRPYTCRHYQPGTDALCALRTNALTERLHIPALNVGRDATMAGPPTEPAYE